MRLESLPSSINVLDITKIKTYKGCPRRFFFSHILGWRPEAESIDLIYGQAYHYAMEEMLLGFKKEGFYSNNTIIRAYNRFVEYYRKYFSEDYDEAYAPKDPSNTMLALTQYAERYNQVDSFDVLYTEVVGEVPISEEHNLHFKIDAILNTDMGITVLEHKTASRRSKVWADSWQLSFQTSAYIHAISSVWPLSEVYGLLVNGTFLRKATKTGMGNEFERVLVRKTKESLRVFLWNIAEWINLLKWDMEQLSEQKVEADILTCFRMNPEDCGSYGRQCPYFDYCMAWSNPLQHMDTPPLGFRKAYWDPREQAENDSKAKLYDGKIIEVDSREEQQQNEEK